MRLQGWQGAPEDREPRGPGCEGGQQPGLDNVHPEGLQQRLGAGQLWGIFRASRSFILLETKERKLKC